MLRLTALDLTDFGPFKGSQTIEFPREDGVAVIYGENMRGKTSLLNAIRFAFFGKVLGRGLRAGALEKVGNWERAAEGVYGFEVRLAMTHDGHSYRLTRTYRLGPGVTEPTSEADYSQSYFLERDGHILGPQQSETELRRILPEQISRFFLFDGELLQEYEDLLVTESDMGPKISEAIERILGIPVLTSARDSLRAAKERAEKRHALAAQSDQKTSEFGTQLASLHAERDVLTKDLERQEEELEGLRTRKTALEETMRKSARIASMIDKRDMLEKEIVELTGRLEQRRGEIASAMGSAWCVLIGNPMRAAVTLLKQREIELQTAIIRTSVLSSLAVGDNAECPACLQPVSDAAQQHVREVLNQQGGETGVAEETELADVRKKLEALTRYLEAASPTALRVLWDNADQIDRDIYTKRGEVDELSKQLADAKEDDVRRHRADYESTIKQISILEQGLIETREEITTNNTYRENIQRKLDGLAGGSLDTERRRRDLADDLYHLFGEGITLFREQLRHRVEADATKHFLALTSEPEYRGLRINDSYGLTIVHQDGTDIPVRSAGAEHIVALSLVGALQNNAPLRGPIIIDSPFGRLDGAHTRKTIRALPSMAKQIVVLVYEDELPPSLAREELKGLLRSEWKLQRRSARHTELVPRED